MGRPPVYMDGHATTPVDPRVVEAMLPCFTERFGNPASRHAYGWSAEESVDRARKQVALSIGASAREIVFTSGATEANNLALKGVADFHRDRGDHFITQATEHRSVLDVFRAIERLGGRITILPVDRWGRVDPDRIREAVTGRTVLVSIMAANNEIGTLQSLREIGEICKRASVLFHTDATQAVGKTPMNVMEMGIDLLSMSAHKIYGPKGAGALYVRSRDPRVRLSSLIDGGGQERGLRSGTLNVPGIVGLGMACELCRQESPAEGNRLRDMGNRLREAICSRLDQTVLNGHPVDRLPGSLHLTFPGVEGELLMMGLKDIALSSGSACTSGSTEPSHVLRAIGLSDDLAHSSLRFGLGRFNTQEEVDYVAGRVIQEVERLRRLAPEADLGHLSTAPALS